MAKKTNKLPTYDPDKDGNCTLPAREHQWPGHEADPAEPGPAHRADADQDAIDDSRIPINH